MHRRFITYFTWLGDELVTVPDFPAWVCDVCGRREFDAHALNRLSLLLAENAGHPSARAPRMAPKQPAEKPEQAKAAAHKQLSKVGGTEFSCAGVEVDLPQAYFLPLSALNALRRGALEQLTRVRTEQRPVRPGGVVKSGAGNPR